MDCKWNPNAAFSTAGDPDEQVISTIQSSGANCSAGKEVSLLASAFAPSLESASKLAHSKG